MITQRLEFGAIPFLQLNLDAADGFTAEELQGCALYAAYVRHDIDLAVQRLANHAFRQPHRTEPAPPHRVDIDHAPAEGVQSKFYLGATVNRSGRFHRERWID